MSTEDTWFFLGAEDEQCGPVSRAELVKLVTQGHVPGGALVWKPGFDGWRPVRDVEELKGAESPADTKAADKKPAEKKASAPKAEAKAMPTTAALQQLLGQSQQAAAKAAAPPSKPASQAKASTARKPGRKDRTPVAIGAVFAVVAVAAVAAMYRYSSPSPAAPQVVAPVAAQPEEMEIPAEAPPEPAVVRVKNPFDAGEVFEFPPGTSKEEARDRVADILMKRAMERQKHFDARTRTTRRR
jgi:hypothetical protein